MRLRLARFFAVALVPTALDVALVIVLASHLEWPLVLADAVAIALASAASYVLHRRITFRSDPYVRWVRLPFAFVLIAIVAGTVDIVVLRSLAGVADLTDPGPLLGAKLVALAVAATVRWFGYRVVLTRSIRRVEHRPSPHPLPASPFALTVVIPAYGEADRIATTIDRLRAALTADGRSVELVVVDDGSTDGTAMAAFDAGADQVVVQPGNAGKGAAVRAGMLVARGGVVAFTDADLAYSPDQVGALSRHVEAGWDVVVGDRRHPAATGGAGSSWLRTAGSRAINFLSFAVLLGSYRDTQCGLKAFRRDVARTVFPRCQLDGFAFDIEVLHLVERYEYSMLSVPVTVEHSARSTVHAARDGFRLVGDLLRVRHWSATGRYELVHR